MDGSRVVHSFQRTTAIRLVDGLETAGSQHVFLGSGSTVEVRKLVHNQWISVYKESLLTGSIIYGFRPGAGGKVAVFGHKSVVILLFDESRLLRVLSPLKTFDDWIHDVMWFEKGDKYTLITAHNRLLVCHLSGDVLSSHASSTNCILYSAKVLPPCDGLPAESVEDLAVVAGTVFNSVVLWNFDIDLTPHTLHSLSGHKGVIFDIDVRLDTQHMCSVSDDRSIRLWCWEYEGAKSWSTTKFHLLRVFNGHTARVWSAVLLDNSRLISIGEDGYVVVWCIDGEMKRRIKSHKSGSVLCLATNKQHVVTAGANASVWLWNIDSLLQEEIKCVTPQRQPFHAPDFPRLLQIEAGMYFILTDRGKVYGNSLVKSLSQMLCDHSDWCLMQCTNISNGLVTIALGSSIGRLKLLLVDESVCVKGSCEWRLELPGKLIRLNWVKSSSQLIASTSEGHSVVYGIDLDKHQLSVSPPLVVLLLPDQKQRFVACACHWHNEDGDLYLTLADMDGSIHLYSFKEEESPQEAKMSVNRVHGKKGLTDMYSMSDVLHTIGRDGYYYKYIIRSGGLCKVDSVKVSNEFSWLARFLPDEDDLKVVAFHTTEILLYDVTLNCVLLRVDCGGGHRSWDFSLHSHSYWLTFIKDKTVQLFRKDLRASFRELAPGFHTGKVTCCDLHLVDSKRLLITGGDDGHVLGTELSSQYRSTHLYSHISSVKCLVSCRSLVSTGVLLVFSGGGRAQVIASKIRIEDSGGFSTLTTCSIFLSRQHKKDKMFTDMRVMSLASVVSTSDVCLHLLFLACSDGTLRCTVYDERRDHMCISTTALYQHSHCLLSTTTTSLPDASALLAVAATDGSILLFTFSSDSIDKELLTCTSPSSSCCTTTSMASVPRQVMAIRNHQSGVNAVLLRHEGEQRVTLCTGGDDNCLVMCDVDVSRQEVMWKRDYNKQHAAQITGIVEAGGNILTSSVDQRLHTWTQQTDSCSWKVTHTKYLSIADTACLSFTCGVVAVGGEGLTILESS